MSVTLLSGSCKGVWIFVTVNAGVGFALIYSLNEHGNFGPTLQAEITQTYMKINADIITLCVIVPAM